MSKITDTAYLRSSQYRDSSNLSKRSGFHKRFGSNEKGWQTWVFEHLELPDQARILEIGSGPAYLWVENASLIPEGWKLFLTDLSFGMVEEANRALQNRPFIFSCVVDANKIPFPESTFDAVVANHMLYHVVDLSTVLVSIRDILKPGGKLFAATNGRGHLHELREIEGKFLKGIEDNKKFWAEGFNLDNGAKILYKYFEHVACFHYPNQLIVTESQAILDYLVSKSSKPLPADILEELKDYLDQELDARGSISIKSEGGLFVSRKM